jgi:serine protease AprX
MALAWYQPVKYQPCFLQGLWKYARRWSKVPVIVQANDDINVLSQEAIAGLAGCRIKKKLPLINAFATEVNEEGLKLLVKDADIKRIWYDAEVKALLDVASFTVNAEPIWQDGLTGKGVVVAVLDTGIYNHPDLSGRIEWFRDFVNNRNKAYDDNGHGTHVAGDIASSGDSSAGRYRGPAPDAGLVGVKVLSNAGMGSLSTVIEGVQWCVNNKDKLKIRIINLSLGSEAYQSYLNDPVCQAVEKAWAGGLVVCAAAGNDGPAPGTINSPGIDPLILTVGACSDMNTLNTEDDRIAVFSSRGPTLDGLMKPDVVAPGENIISLRSPGSFMDKRYKQHRVGTWYTSLSGTSMATPVCAGVAAQILQADSSLTPDQVKRLLMETARDLPDADNNNQGAGVVDAQQAAGMAGPAVK